MKFLSVKRAWRGQEKLVKVFWIYGTAPYGFFLLLAYISTTMLFHAIISEKTGAFIGTLLHLIYFVYTILFFILIWKNAFNTKTKIWAYMARVFVVLSIPSVFSYLPHTVSPKNSKCYCTRFQSVKAAPSDHIECMYNKNGIISREFGACKSFSPPQTIAVGEKFSANGKTITIGAIEGIHADKDMPNYGSGPTRKGQWFCSAAKNKNILDQAPRPNGVWLIINPCLPVSPQENMTP